MSAIRREQITSASNQISDALTAIKKRSPKDDAEGDAFISIIAGLRSLLVGIASDLNEINERQVAQEIMDGD